MLFFVLFFPPALMTLLLVQTQPSDLVQYFLAGYMMAAFPAVVVAVIDEVLERTRLATRTTWCALAGFVLAPAAMWFFGGDTVWQMVRAAACGGLAAFLTTAVFAKLDEPAASEPKASAGILDAVTDPAAAPAA
jgi:hypothetical protein